MIKTTKDGRTIRTGTDYTKFRKDMWDAQDARCKACDRFTSINCPLEYDYAFHVHHKNGRGMGGSKRDDTFEACQGDCGKCHRAEHNQGIREKAQNV